MADDEEIKSQIIKWSPIGYTYWHILTIDLNLPDIDIIYDIHISPSKYGHCMLEIGNEDGTATWLNPDLFSEKFPLYKNCLYNSYLAIVIMDYPSRFGDITVVVTGTSSGQNLYSILGSKLCIPYNKDVYITYEKGELTQFNIKSKIPNLIYRQKLGVK